MNEAEIRKKLAEINEVMIGSWATGPGRSPQGTYVSCPAMPTGIEESIENLRLQVRYVMFDLEATRRENRYLRHLLNSGSHREGDDSRRDDPPMH